MPYGRDEQAYVIDLCDEILGEAALREHRFDWLRGDPGRDGRRGMSLPVDAYYPSRGLVVEYWECQHDEPVAFFDKPDRMTVSGVSRGEQRAIYDRRRAVLVPRHGLELVIVRAAQLAITSRGRLIRDRDRDLSVLQAAFGQA